MLANRFVARYCAANGLPLDAKVFSHEAVSRLISYHWPGNIRELESTVSRAALSAPGPGDPRQRHRVPARPRADRADRRRAGRSCRRCATPSAPTSCACSRPCRGTRRRRRGCSKSAAARSTGRSSSTSSNRTDGLARAESAYVGRTILHYRNRWGVCQFCTRPITPFERRGASGSRNPRHHRNLHLRALACR